MMMHIDGAMPAVMVVKHHAQTKNDETSKVEMTIYGLAVKF
jgi:hypothetical protein